MGYYTEHTLTARGIRNEEQFKELEAELTERDLIHYAFDEGTYYKDRYEAIYYPYDSCKWYDHSQDMVAIAEKFPNIFFELEGTGEEFGDFWREYYHDMDIEYCKGEIVFEQPKHVQWTQLIRN